MKSYELRQALPRDLISIQYLLQQVKLPTTDVEKYLEHFLVAEDQKQIIGCVGIEIYEEVCLLRSLAVSSAYQSRGMGKKLWQEILEYACQQGVKEAYLLTETAAEFFSNKFDFCQIPREKVHSKVKQSFEFREVCCANAVCMKKILK